MALKTTIAAGFATIIMSLFAGSSAEAGTKVVIGFGNFGWGVQSCWGWPRRCGWRPHHRNFVYVPRHHNKFVVYSGGNGGKGHARGISCAAAGKVVSRNGYASVRTNDCRGDVFTFNARKNGKFHRVRVNAHNGHIIGSYRY